MMMAMVDVDPMQYSILVVVMEADNFERMRKADPITLESQNKGGLLPPPRYPQNFSVLIAYETNDAELYKVAKRGGLELLKYLERGRRWRKGEDGVENSFKLNTDEAGTVPTDEEGPC